MKKPLKITLLSCLLAAIAAVSARKADADLIGLDFTGGEASAFFNDSPRTAGWSFTTDRSVTITDLGYWDEGSDGIMSHEVGIWSDAGILLRSTTVDGTSAATPSASANGQWSFESITPLTIGPGKYRIGAVTGPSDSLADAIRTDRSNAGGPPMTLIPTAGVTWVSAAFSPASSGFAFPDFENFPLLQGGYFGPNFKVIPEPSVYLIWSIVGLVGLGISRRRRKAA